MATKTYYSRSDISISVLVDKKSVHLSFTPVTGSGSVFMTTDERIQNAIEKHHNFGRLFKLRQDEPQEEPSGKKGGKSKAKGLKDGIDSGNDTDTVNDDDSFYGDGKTVITVSCPDDAKDYLADKFGISRTSMKNVKAIKAIAESKNIEFSGI